MEIKGGIKMNAKKKYICPLCKKKVAVVKTIFSDRFLCFHCKKDVTNEILDKIMRVGKYEFL